MIAPPPPVLPEEPAAVTPHGGIRGAKASNGCATRQTRAELPFTGDQVSLFRAQPGRPKECDCSAAIVAALLRGSPSACAGRKGSEPETETTSAINE